MAQGQSSQRKSGGSRSGSRNKRPNPVELARAARSQLAELTGRVPESVLGLRQDDDGWRVMVEVVELSRVPSSTDLLGLYAITLDDDGQLVGYERVRRYQRGQSGGDEQ
jgi:gas vesicle protein GvpO